MTDTLTPLDSDDGIPERRGRRRRVWIIVAVVVGIPLAVLGSAGSWFWFQLHPRGGAGDIIEVRVDDGWSVSRIGDELADRDIVGSSLVFTVYARLTGKTDFQAGTYDLRENMGVSDAISTLEGGPRIDYVELALPPGLWLREIIDRVGELPGRDRQAFEDATRNGSARSKYQPDGQMSLEGLLWPDTYRISDSQDEIDILEQLVNQFDARADEIGLATATTEGRSPYEILVVASLVEAEAKVDEDRPLIASVIYNRLREGMKLQIDATVLYAVGDPQKQTITVDDLQFDSPWNTYVVDALPPTPIASVTEASLRAAIAPAQTDFLFYVIADETGRHAFAETDDEHAENVEAARARGLL